MKLKLNNKKMETFGIILCLVCGIGVAIGIFIVAIYSGKTNNEKHIQVIDQSKNIKEGVDELKNQTTTNFKDMKENSTKNTDELKEYITKGVKDVKMEMRKDEIILVSPSEIITPANAAREVPLVITNNHDYPVFFISFELKVTEGEIDMTSDFLLTPFYGGGFWGPKSYSCSIPQINARGTINFLVKIDGNKYSKPSKIKLTVSSYMKEPPPIFSMAGQTDLPKTLKLPDGFMPKVYPNK